MAMFVHLAPATSVERIRRNGIWRTRRAHGDVPRGLYAVPVTRNFYVSHQWLRELKRRGVNTIAGVYFRTGDRETVWVGHYGQAHQSMTAAEAVATFMSGDDRQGWEVIIPRRGGSRQPPRVRMLPQVVGWRFWPGAKGRPPCTCSYCTRGAYGGRRLRARAAGG